MMQHNPLKIGSFNIRAGLGTDWRRQPVRVLDQINRMAPDVIALQEADFRMGARPPALPPALIREHTDLVPLPIGANGISLGWHGNAILTRPEITLAELHRIDLPGAEPRGAVIADLVNADDPAFHLRLVAVHLGLLRRSRRQQLDHIRASLAQLPHRPTVILGDFNEWSNVRGLGRVAKHFNLHTPPATFPAVLPRLSLDRMVATPDVSLRFLDVARGQFPYPSDHVPILAEALITPAG